MRYLNLICLSILIVCILFGCQSAVKQTNQNKVILYDVEKPYADEMNAALQKKYSFIREKSIENVLQKVAQKIINTDEKLAEEFGEVHFILLDIDSFIATAGLAHTIYFSIGILDSIEYENELAFLVATQIALLKDHVPANRMKYLYGQEVLEEKAESSSESIQKSFTFVPRYLQSKWFEEGGFFNFGEQTYSKADLTGIKLMYSAQYDPRGSTSLIKKWQKPNWNKNYSKFSKIVSSLKSRFDFAQDEVAKLSPQRDSIVKSAIFENFQSKIHSIVVSKKRNQ